LDHIAVRLVRECLFRKKLWEMVSSRWIYNIKLLYCFLQKRYMFFWPKQELYRLPCYESLLLESRYTRRRIPIRVWRRLQAVQCAEASVNKREGSGRSAKEKDVKIATARFVESGQLRRPDIFTIMSSITVSLVSGRR
jgi:hypothetical protein